MRKIFSLIFIIGVISFSFGCGAKNISKGDIPGWYLNPPESKEKIYGTGASEKTQSIELARQVADTNARNSLASIIQISVQSIVRSFLQQSGNMEAARALQFAETVSKQVVNMKLSGVTISKREIKDGRCYSLAEISMDTMQNALLNAVRDSAAQVSEAKAKEAFKDLETEVSKGNIPVVKP